MMWKHAGVVGSDIILMDRVPEEGSQVLDDSKLIGEKSMEDHTSKQDESNMIYCSLLQTNILLL